MKARTRITLVLAMIAALLISVSGGAGAQERTQEEQDDVYVPMSGSDVERLIEEEMGYWVALRHDLNFPSDPDTIAAIARSSIARESLESSGIPLTATEQVELSRRVELGAEGAELVRLSLTNKPWFGGAHIDHLAGGVLVISHSSEIPALDR